MLELAKLVSTSKKEDKKAYSISLPLSLCLSLVQSDTLYCIGMIFYDFDAKSLLLSFYYTEILLNIILK